MFDLLFYMGSWFWGIIIIIGFVTILNKISKINQRLDKLESRKVALDNKVENPTQTVSLPKSAPEINSVQFTNINDEQNVVTTSDISNWFRENLLLKVGLLMILAGFGWFVSYAFAHNWIGPVGRITLGVLLGVAVLLAGTFRLGKNIIQGRSLTILGSALIVISVLAGEYYYSFFTPIIVLLITFIVSLYVTMTSVAYNDENLSIYGVVASLFAPYFSHSLGMDMLTLFGYLAVASLAIIWVSIYRNWKNVSALGMTGVLLYSSAYLLGFGSPINYYEQKYILLCVGYVIALIYLFVDMWTAIKSNVGTYAENLYISLANSGFILILTLTILPDIYQSLILAVWMIVFGVVGFVIFEVTKNEKMFYIHSCIAVLFLGIATSIELSGPTLVIGFTIESALLILTSYIVTNKAEVAERLSITFLLPILMSLSSIDSSKWRQGIMHSDFIVLFLIAIVLMLLGVFFMMHSAYQNSKSKSHQLAFTLSSIYAFILVWKCNHSLLDNADTAVFLSLFIYTVVGLGTHFYGLFNQKESLKKYGMAVLIVVVGRLVLIDVWNMDLVLRVITFIVLGVMFMSSAFISKKQNTLN